MNKAKQLNNLLIKTFGKGTSPNRQSEVSFYCPFCNHHKKKLAINLISHKWHCWICDAKGGDIYQLFRKAKITNKAYYDELKTIVPDKNITSKDDIETIMLPVEFKSLQFLSPQPEYKRAMKYLNSRNISMDDIIKFNIGYCEEGQFRERVIIPSYDKSYNLNYFVGRSSNENPFKYKNPKISKNIVGFESYIDWNNPIVLVEGVFDAIAMRHNAIPLFGKTLPKLLRERISKYRPEYIYICLDSDALNDAIKIAWHFIKNGIENVYIIEMSVGDDPSSIGYHKM